MNKFKNGTLWAVEPSYFEEFLSSDNSSLVLNASNALSLPSPSKSFEGTRTKDTAIIPLYGLIDRKSQVEFKNQLQAALNDSSITSIVAHISSGGGLVAGTKELADFIYSVRGQKDMLAYADGLCASAAMWIASAFGKIYAPATTTLGSVGVVSVITTYAGLNKNFGIECTYIQAGKWKTVGNPDNPPTKEEKEYLQTRINQIHEIFKADIIKNLSLDNEKSDFSLWNEAQVFLAGEAKNIGFIKDIVQDLSKVCENLQNEKETIFMDLKTLAEKHPDLYQAVLDEGKALAVQESKVENSSVQEAGDDSANNQDEEKEAANVEGLSTALASIMSKEQLDEIALISKLGKEANVSFEQSAKIYAGLKTQGKVSATTKKESAEQSILDTLVHLSNSVDVSSKVTHEEKSKASSLVADAAKRS